MSSLNAFENYGEYKLKTHLVRICIACNEEPKGIFCNYLIFEDNIKVNTKRT